jgi:hypothetical protein
MLKPEHVETPNNGVDEILQVQSNLRALVFDQCGTVVNREYARALTEAWRHSCLRRIVPNAPLRAAYQA